MRSINEIPVGSKGVVTMLKGSDALTKRLAALGCLPGTELKITRKAPLGDPLVINFRGFSLAIRQEDAKGIFLEV